MSYDVERTGANDPLAAIRANRDQRAVLAAVKELARRRSPDRLGVFRTLLADPSHSTATKKTVAVELGKEVSIESQAALATQLNTDVAQVFAAAARSLGQIGDEQGLEALEKAAPLDDAVSRQQLEFARSLIAYRLHLNKHRIAFASGGAAHT